MPAVLQRDTGSIYFALTRNQLKQLRLGDDAYCLTTVILSRVQKKKYVEDTDDARWKQTLTLQVMYNLDSLN